MKIFFLCLFLFGIIIIFGQRSIADADGLGSYDCPDKNASTYIHDNYGSSGNIYQFFAATRTGSASVRTYGASVNSCGGSDTN